MRSQAAKAILVERLNHMGEVRREEMRVENAVMVADGICKLF